MDWLLGTGFIIIILIIVKVWYYLQSGTCTSLCKLTGKTVLITGGSAGIGKETAYDLASRGARLILGCRNLVKAQGVADEIIRTTGNKNIVVHKLDTSDLSSVRAFAKVILETESSLHVLINNAGTGAPKTRTQTSDGLEMTMATNHYGHFLLTNLLLDLLKKSGPSRIINVSSISHTFISKLDPENLNFEKSPFNTHNAYSQSKLCNVLFTLALADKLKGTSVTVNSLHPGFVNTEIFTKANGILVLIIKYLAPIFAKNSKSGAQTSIYLAVSEDVQNITGKYFVDCKDTPTSKLGEHLGLAKKLWLASELDVKLQSREIHY